MGGAPNILLVYLVVNVVLALTVIVCEFCFKKGKKRNAD